MMMRIQLRQIQFQRFLSFAVLLMAFQSFACLSRRDVITAVPTRVAREIAGERAYVHPTVTTKPEVVKYKIVAVKKLDNLMLDEIPVSMYNYLNTEIVRDISAKKLFTEVLPIQDEVELTDGNNDPPTLLLDGFVDNYNGGSEALRIAELGLNHAVVTIRIELKDAHSSEVLAAASITVYERGIARTGKSAIHKAAESVADFLQKQVAQTPKTHG
jgi:hypothetical protein